MSGHMKRDQVIEVRVSLYEKNKAQLHADKWADGSLSRLVRHALVTFERMYIKKEGRKRKSSKPS